MLWAERGFTLLEALTTLAVLLILISIAVPSFQSLMAKNRATVAVNDFIGDFHLSRSEAVKRRHKLTMCPSHDGLSCDGGLLWQSGWLIFIDNINPNNDRDTEEEIIRIHGALPQGLTMTSTRLAPLVFDIDGQTPGSNRSFYFCDQQDQDYGRAVIISNEGRLRTDSNMTQTGKTCG